MTKQGLRDLNNYGPKKEKGAPRNPVEEGVADVAEKGDAKASPEAAHKMTGLVGAPAAGATDAATTDAAMPSPAPVVGLA